MCKSQEQINKEVAELLDSMSREELITLLKESGIEVIENGTGKVIFTDEIQ